MKSIAVSVVGAVLLAGCVTITSGPSHLPSNAYSAMWSMGDQASVQQCLSQHQLTSIYQAQALDPNKSVYRTVVSTTSAVVPAEQQRAATVCAQIGAS